MKIHINDERKISDIQEEFSGLFPWLKLEFFSKPHKEGGPSPKDEIITPSKTLGEARTIRTEGSIIIEPSMTVADVEKAFRDVYGLSAQVFRQSGKSWLETTVTDKWTLEHQNEEGKILSQPAL